MALQQQIFFKGFGGGVLQIEQVDHVWRTEVLQVAPGSEEAKAISELVYPHSTGAESPFVVHLNAGLKACSSTVADTVIVELL